MATQIRAQGDGLAKDELSAEPSGIPAHRAMPQRYEATRLRSRRNRRMRAGGTSADQQGTGLATFLGWFSIGLGLAQLISPRGLANTIGLRHDRGIMPFIGIREVATGIGILSQRRPAEWVWGRVIGDIMDLFLLAAAFRARDARPDRLTAATAAVGGITVLDAICAQQLSMGTATGAGRVTDTGAIRAVKAVTIGRPPEELYRFWRNSENLPRFMSHLESVENIDDRRSHWVVIGPAGRKFEWDAEVTDDRPNRCIEWRAIGHADVPNRGAVRFDPAPGNRGTEVRVEVEYYPPGGTLGAIAAKMLGQAPEQQLQEDLRRLKQLIEVGETLTTEGQPSGRKAGLFGRRISVARILEREAR